MSGGMRIQRRGVNSIMFVKMEPCSVNSVPMEPSMTRESSPAGPGGTWTAVLKVWRGQPSWWSRLSTSWHSCPLRTETSFLPILCLQQGSKMNKNVSDLALTFVFWLVQSFRGLDRAMQEVYSTLNHCTVVLVV